MGGVFSLGVVTVFSLGVVTLYTKQPVAIASNCIPQADKGIFVILIISCTTCVSFQSFNRIHL